MIPALAHVVKSAVLSLAEYDWGDDPNYLSYSRTSNKWQSKWSHYAQRAEIGRACWARCGVEPLHHFDEVSKGGRFGLLSRPVLLQAIGVAQIRNCPIVAMDWTRFVGSGDVAALGQFGVQFLTVRELDLTREELRILSISAGKREGEAIEAFGGGEFAEHLSRTMAYQGLS